MSCEPDSTAKTAPSNEQILIRALRKELASKNKTLAEMKQ